MRDIKVRPRGGGAIAMVITMQILRCIFASGRAFKGVILTGPGSIWFGNVVILTRPVQ